MSEFILKGNANKKIKKTDSPGSTTFRFPIRPTKVWNFCPGSHLCDDQKTHDQILFIHDSPRAVTFSFEKTKKQTYSHIHLNAQMIGHTHKCKKEFD